MFRAAIAFFVLALLAVLVGANGIAGISMEIGRLLLGIFLVLAILSLVVGLVRGKDPKIIPVILVAMAFSAFALEPAMAEQTAGEKVDKAGRDIKRGTKKFARNVQDKTCEMVNGKMECVAKDAKHAVQNGADKAVDSVKDAKDKAD